MPVAGASASCPDWCDAVGSDLLSFAIALVGAVVLLLLIYGFTRRALARRKAAAGISAAVAVGIAIALTTGLTARGLDIFQRHSRPTVAFGPHGLTLADPAFLGGNYVVRWSAASGPAVCHLEAHLLQAD